MVLDLFILEFVPITYGMYPEKKSYMYLSEGKSNFGSLVQYAKIVCIVYNAIFFLIFKRTKLLYADGN